ncbi:uncharacterized protein LOC130295046 [Hyla sarda]|uniref:uncharacterized protein LOC130295046 n=1 Tax=Hyla sarda TaxID=327740 RepID=UPI0024C376CB|nr:uncharacterized protein LOC130295046 [Hyla sarda]
MAAISRHARQTGGGPSCPEKLWEMEEKVGSTCKREQIEGFGMADVCMQALSNRENVSTEPTEQINEEIPVETREQPHSEGDEPTNENQSSPVNPRRQTEEMLFPADLGLSEQQTTYINDYTNQDLQFMRRVDSRFDCHEKGLNNLANAYLSGANTISLGLHKIANLLEGQTGGVPQNILSPSATMPQSVANPHPDAECLPALQVSPCSFSTEHTVGSVNMLQANVAESVSLSQSVF